MEQLIKIQSELKAPKNQRNKFGNYNYRSCEDILEAVKTLLEKYECELTISDEIKEITGIPYVEATARLRHGDKVIQVSAQAGIDPSRKGMDIAQSFGSSSSYARKYALNGLFLIDDNKDADATNKDDKTYSKPTSNTIDHAVEVIPKVEMSVESAGDTKIHFGKNEGTSIRELTEKQLLWYKNEWDPTSKGKYPIKEQDQILKNSLNKYSEYLSGSNSTEKADEADEAEDEVPMFDERVRDYVHEQARECEGDVNPF